MTRPRAERASEVRDLVVARLMTIAPVPIGRNMKELIYAIVYEVLQHIEDGSK